MIGTIIYTVLIIIGIAIIIMLISNLYSYYYIIKKLRETNTILFNELQELRRK